MKIIYWPGLTFVTGNRIADALMVFVSTLNDIRPHAIVTVPRVTADGAVETVRILCNRLSSFVAAPAPAIVGLADTDRRDLDEREFTSTDVEWPHGRPESPQQSSPPGQEWGYQEYF